ncbi:MAG TPA: TIGR03066 family protein [Urbifossiella sp.]|nr:TIGR03066 family protein [Urbifossiella sp.]
MRTVTVGLAAAVLVLVAGGTTVGQDTKTKLDAKLLVGKWTPDDEAKRDKMTIEFLKDGKLALGFKFGEKEAKIDGTYKLDGDQLTVKMSFMGQEKSEVMTVNKLTAKTLVTTDEKGKKDTLVRIAAKTEKKTD